MCCQRQQLVIKFITIIIGLSLAVENAPGTFVKVDEVHSY